MVIPPYDQNPNSRFLGFPMSQNRYAVPAWSYFLEVHKPPRIVEIGTHCGGLTCCFAIAARNYGGRVWSFDPGDQRDQMGGDYLGWFNFLGIEFVNADCFAPESEELIESIIANPGQCLLLCDGGDKRREFNHFARYLKAGDIIAAHDFASTAWPWQEIQERDVAKVSHELRLEYFMKSIFEPTGWMVKVKL